MNFNAETGVLGSLLIDPVPVLPLIRRELTADDFTTVTAQAVFNAACRLADSGRPVDAITIQTAAAADGVPLDSDYLMELMDTTPTAANVEAYISGAKDASAKRRLRAVAEGMIARLKAGEASADVFSAAQAELQSAADGQTLNSLVTGQTAMADFLNYRADVDAGRANPAVATGCIALDDLLGGGMVQEGFYILAARPGAGKTTLGLNIAEKVVSRGEPVLFVSLEMSLRQLTAKRLAAVSNISTNKILNHRLLPDEYSRLMQAMKDIGGRPLTFNAKPQLTVPEIGFLARQVRGCKLVIIDYLGLINHGKGSSLYEKVTATSNELKRLARKLGIPILCLAQLNREVESRADKRPMLSDLRDSGAIEQDADGIMLLSGVLNDKREPHEPAEIELILAKNRHAGTGSLNLKIYLPTGVVRITKKKQGGSNGS